MPHRDSLGHTELHRLAEFSSFPCVSLYLSTHEAGFDVGQDRITFKNLLKTTERELKRIKVAQTAIDETLQAGKRLLNDIDFWKHQSKSLALFLCRGSHYSYRLPVELFVEYHISSSFHLKPLLSLVAQDATFYLLALSQKQVRFFKASRLGMSETFVPGMPKDLGEVLSLYESSKQSQSHASPSSFHGHGGGGATGAHKVRIREYFQRIDTALKERLRGSMAPLLFAGVEYLFPLYREVNSYGQLMDEIVPGNPDQLSTLALHQKAWPLVAPVFKGDRKIAIERFKNSRLSGDASSDLIEIVQAAHRGRIDVLFVPAGFHQWGRFDSVNEEVSLHDAREIGDKDLLDIAATQTYLHGGTVYVLMPDELEEPFPLGAIFRYQLQAAAGGE